MDPTEARVLLLDYYETSKECGKPLRSILVSKAREKAEEIGSGQVIASVEADGVRVSNSKPGSTGRDPSAAGKAPILLVELFDRIKQELIDGGNPTPTDQQIFDSMYSALMVPRIGRTTYGDIRR